MPAPTTKKTIAIFFGGCSTEYEVSLQSACSVIQSIDTTRFTPILIGIDRKSGQWYLYHGTTAQIENGCNITVVAASKEHMLLGKGLLYRDVYQRIENILNIEMQKYIDEIYID